MIGDEIFLEPVGDEEAGANASHWSIVVDETFTIAVKKLHVAAVVLADRVTPIELKGAAVLFFEIIVKSH